MTTKLVITYDAAGTPHFEEAGTDPDLYALLQQIPQVVQEMGISEQEIAEMICRLFEALGKTDLVEIHGERPELSETSEQALSFLIEYFKPTFSSEVAWRGV